MKQLYLKKYRDIDFVNAVGRTATASRSGGPPQKGKEVIKMFKKSFTLFAAGIMMAGMLAGTAAGTIDAMAAEKISEAEAKEIATEDAGHSVNDVRFDRVEVGTEQGASVYEIEFKTADVEYDYDIAIADGEIVKESRELRRPSASGSQVSRARAKEIALKDA